MDGAEKLAKRKVSKKPTEYEDDTNKARLYLPPVIDNMWKCQKCSDTCITYDYKPLKPFGCCLDHLGNSLTCTQESEYEQCGFFGLAYENEVNKDCRNFDTERHKEYSYSADGSIVFLPGVKVKFDNIPLSKSPQYVLLMATDDGVDYTVVGYEVLPRGNWAVDNFEKNKLEERWVYKGDQNENKKKKKKKNEKKEEDEIVDDVDQEEAPEEEDVVEIVEQEEEELLVEDQEEEQEEDILPEEDAEEVEVIEDPIEDIAVEVQIQEEEILVEADIEEEIDMVPGERKVRRKLPERLDEDDIKEELQKIQSRQPEMVRVRQQKFDLPSLVCVEKRNHVVITNGCYKAFNGAPKSLGLLPCIANEKYNPLPKTSSKYRLTRGKSYKYNDLGTICNMTTFGELPQYKNKEKKGVLSQEEKDQKDDIMFDYYGMYITTDDAAIDYLELNSKELQKKFADGDIYFPQIRTSITNFDFDTKSVFLYDKDFKPKGASSHLSNPNYNGFNGSIVIYVLGGLLAIALTIFAIKYGKSQNNHQYSTKTLKKRGSDMIEGEEE